MLSGIEKSENAGDVVLSSQGRYGDGLIGLLFRPSLTRLHEIEASSHRRNMLAIGDFYIRWWFSSARPSQYSIILCRTNFLSIRQLRAMLSLARAPMLQFFSPPLSRSAVENFLNPGHLRKRGAKGSEHVATFFYVTHSRPLTRRYCLKSFNSS
jgi:hypothetical protein